MNRNKRLYYLDNIKVVLTILVIMVHASVTYGGAGDWYYIEGSNSNITKLLLTFFNAITQAFFMGFFFFISGYFTPSACDRKGIKKFVKDRLIRLGIPLAIYTAVINPFIVLSVMKTTEGYNGSFINVLLNMDKVSSGPLWFVQTLLIFSFFYILIKKYIGKNKVWKMEFPSVISIFLILVTAGVFNFALRLIIPAGEEIFNMKIGYFPMYILLYFAGVISYRNNWLEKVNLKNTLIFLSVSMISIIAFAGVMASNIGGGPQNFFGGLRWQSLFYSMWEPFTATGIIFSFLYIFRSFFNGGSRISKFMSNQAYAVYIFHSPILVLTSLSIRRMDMSSISKFALITLVVTLVTYLFSYLIRRVKLLQIL